MERFRSGSYQPEAVNKSTGCHPERSEGSP